MTLDWGIKLKDQLFDCFKYSRRWWIWLSKKNSFLNIAKGSAAYVATQIIIAKEVGYISHEQQEVLENATHKIKASIKNYIQILKKKNSYCKAKHP